MTDELHIVEVVPFSALIVMVLVWLAVGVVCVVAVEYLAGAEHGTEADVLCIFAGPAALVILPVIIARRWIAAAKVLRAENARHREEQRFADLGRLALTEFLARRALGKHQCETCGRGETCQALAGLEDRHSGAAWALDVEAGKFDRRASKGWLQGHAVVTDEEQPN